MNVTAVSGVGLTDECDCSQQAGTDMNVTAVNRLGLTDECDCSQQAGTDMNVTAVNRLGQTDECDCIECRWLRPCSKPHFLAPFFQTLP